MSSETIGTIFQWAFNQDPVVLLVVALLIRAEIKRGAVSSVVAELLAISKGAASDSKPPVSQGS